MLTSLTPDEILERLALNVNTDQRVNWFTNDSNNDYLYEGRISSQKFDIKRVINYRNSFNPQIKGTISTEKSGCRIQIVMSLHPAVLVFMCMWMGGLLIGGISIMVSQIIEQKFQPASLFIIAMFLFGYVLTTGGYKYESNDSIRFLNEMFEAQEI
ncbi:MAG: hypothetical protein ABIN91_05085 [Mucilaginibacter sp.]